MHIFPASSKSKLLIPCPGDGRHNLTSLLIHYFLIRMFSRPGFSQPGMERPAPSSWVIAAANYDQCGDKPAGNWAATVAQER